MLYIIKKVPRIPAVNKFGIEYTGNKTWDYKNTMYFQEDGKWNRSYTRAKRFEGTMADARAEATRIRICSTDPDDHSYIGPVEAVLDEYGDIHHTLEHH